MKTKYILATLISGFGLILMGSCFKILHFAGAQQLLLLGFALEVLGCFLMALKVIKTKDFKNFWSK